MLEDNKARIFRQIGLRVAYYRKLRGLTQLELARKAQISISVIGRLERGKYNKNIPMGLLIDVAAALEVEYSLLVADVPVPGTWWGNADIAVLHKKGNE